MKNEVIHIVYSPAQAAAELPEVLRGKAPSKASDSSMPQLGTQRYDRTPSAVLVGGGYDDEMLKSMRDACSSVSKVPWLHHDWNYHATHGGPAVGEPGYAESVVGRIKTKLRELQESDKLDVDGVYRY